jgi:hypothetical protein
VPRSHRSLRLQTGFRGARIDLALFQPDDPIQVLPGMLEVADVPIQAAALVVGRQVIRIERDRPIEVGESAVALDCLPMADAAIREGRDKIAPAVDAPIG